MSNPYGNLYAKKGEIVTCENGHPVLEIQIDIFVGDQQDPDKQFKFFDDQVAPMIGEHEKDISCHCGAKWFRTITRPYTMCFNVPEFHFEDGWR